MFNEGASIDMTLFIELVCCSVVWLCAWLWVMKALDSALAFSESSVDRNGLSDCLCGIVAGDTEAVA